MTVGLFRVRLRDGDHRLARGEPYGGPSELLAEDLDLDSVIGQGRVAEVLEGAGEGRVPEGTQVLAPIGSQEVWAAGVTYLRSREARVEEARDRTPYDLVYEAERPELFFKTPAWRVRGPGEPIAVRADSDWNAPEPELALVLDAVMRVIGYTIGNDVSSRSIEGENPLYLPQAKLYDGSCALGPCIVPVDGAPWPMGISMAVSREGAVVFEGETSTDRMKRTPPDLAAYLGRALAFPAGAVLLTGTGIVPEADFTLTPGDVVRIEIAGLGVLENPVESVGRSE